MFGAIFIYLVFCFLCLSSCTGTDNSENDTIGAIVCIVIGFFVLLWVWLT